MVTFSITLSDRPRASISRCLNAGWDRKRFAIVSARDARPGIGPRIPGAIVARFLPRVKRGLGTINPLAVPEELETRRRYAQVETIGPETSVGGHHRTVGVHVVAVTVGMVQ